MVFSRSAKLGIAVVVPARAECCDPEDLLDEAKHLWIAECDARNRGVICSEFGRVCIIENPDATIPEPILNAWQGDVAAAGNSYAPLPTAEDEEPVLNEETGRALFDWPTDTKTSQPLSGFDLLLMTTTKPSPLRAAQYPTPKEIADAWRTDKRGNVMYFYNNRHFGITTFQDEEILKFLEGER